MKQLLPSTFTRAAFLLCASLAVACSSGDEPRTDDQDTQEPDSSEPDASEPTGPDPLISEDGFFESSNPGGESGAERGGSDDDSSDDGSDNSLGAPGSNGPPNAESDDPDASAERAIEEADIIKLEGDTLYALSRYGGISVIDVSNPGNLRLLGRHKVMAEPFEMYVREGVALVLYNGYGEYQHDEAEDLWTWYQTSFVVALDTSAPSEIREIGRFPVAGYISDSRLVGDVMYVAAFEDGYCWQCDRGPRTNLMSLDVSQPRAIVLVDELSFEESENVYGWKKSLSSTDERMYIAGPAWGSGEQPAGSVIQVVDISDRSGDMLLGAGVQVGGQIESRWQMDEYQGVLRVISQPFTWRTDQVPVIETFSVHSSANVELLGSLPMVLPRPERLQSVRFDGDRGYAITFEQTDPLFTIDLSNPAQPLQMGELEIPGWVHYMHPHGDRLLGLGFDPGNNDGGLTVSLFDVSDLSTPTMLSRVNFGGNWGWFAEDQDRIHKAFNVMDDQDLILVPFSGYSYDTLNGECGNSEYHNGVQLVEWNDETDTLALRGVAPARGQARRGFMHRDTLFTMSDDRLETFDIANRDAPASRDSLPLALRVDQLATSGDTLVAIGRDWWTGVAEIRTTSLDEINDPTAGAVLELPQLSRNECYGGSYLTGTISGERYTHFLYYSYSYDRNYNNYTEGTRIVSVDVQNPKAPRVAGDIDLGFTPDYYWGYYYGLVNNGLGSVSVGDTLVFLRNQYEYDERGNSKNRDYGVTVVDLSRPASPAIEDVTLPYGLGATGLLVNDKVLATSHFEQSPTNPNRVRFFIDRVDLSDPKNPRVLPPVNVPGSLLAYDADAKRAITVDYRTFIKNTTERACYETERGGFEYPANVNWDTFSSETTLGRCHVTIQTLRLVAIDDDRAQVVDSHTLEQGESVGTTSLGDNRLFVALNGSSYYYYGYAIADDVAIGPGYYGYYSSFSTNNASVLTLGGIHGGSFEAGRVEIETGNNYYGNVSHLLAVGKRAVVSTGWQGKLSVIDAQNAKRPIISGEVDVAGYVQDLKVVGNVAVAAMGYDGVQTLKLTD